MDTHANFCLNENVYVLILTCKSLFQNLLLTYALNVFTARRSLLKLSVNSELSKRHNILRTKNKVGKIYTPQTL